jgi:hypothetical protein
VRVGLVVRDELPVDDTRYLCVCRRDVQVTRARDLGVGDVVGAAGGVEIGY